MVHLRRVIGVALVAWGACTPTLEDRTAVLTSPRVLAVRAVPPEAPANAAVQLTALYADANGVVVAGPTAWTLCNARRELAELGPVSVRCFDPADPAQFAIGAGPSVATTVPTEACRNFGPNPPPAMADQPAGRPADPDSTGGYYQPVMVFGSDATRDAAYARVRLACGLADAPSDVRVEFNQRYRRNENPSIAGLVVDRSGVATPVPEDGTGAPIAVQVGERLALRVSWPACPTSGVCGDGVCGDDETMAGCAADCTTPLGCEGAETYLAYDLATATLVHRREAMRVAFYLTGGRVETPRVGRSGDDEATDVDGVVVAPDTAGDLVLFVVITDERGGTDFRSYRFAVSQ